VIISKEAEYDQLFADYSIEGDEDLRGVIERMNSAACAFRGELTVQKEVSLNLVSKLRNCALRADALTRELQEARRWRGGKQSI